jgi:L-iditol 2-dehydrogenase
MDMSMKAVVKTASGDGNVSLEDVTEPEPPAGHVLIAVEAAGICGTDIHILHDEFRSWPPVVMGHEFSGRVVALGSGVTSIAVNDRVTSETYYSTCGVCNSCRDGRANLCLKRRSIGSAMNGAFAPLIEVPARNVHHLPEGVEFRAGALVEPLACVVHGVQDGCRILPGDVAVVSGPGTIGLLALQVLRASGARVLVLGTEVDAHRLNVAMQLGAEAALVVDRDDVRAEVQQRTGGRGADVVVECSGAGAAVRDVLELARRGGHYTQIGLFGKSVSLDLDQICFKELTVSGSNASLPSAWRRALDLLARNQVSVEPLISAQYAISDWRKAFDEVEMRSGLKVLLSANGEENRRSA